MFVNIFLKNMNKAIALYHCIVVK